MIATIAPPGSTMETTLMPLTPAILDRALGSFIGLAVGDAVGTTVEFQPRGSFPPVTDMTGGGPFRLAAGQWTDDTSMALCLAESLLHDSDLDPLDLMQRFHRWVDEGYNASTGRCFDIGHTTSSAIMRFRKTGVALAGSTDPREAGNGSIMRLAPVATRWWHDPPTAERIARAQSQTTHGAAEAVDACALLARILCAAVAGRGLAALAAPIDPAWRPSIAAIAAGTWRDKTTEEIASTGYAVHTLEAAVWACARSRTFEEAILTGVNLGHDADSVGAVTGQIAGALFGLAGIPRRWLDRLHDGARILTLGQALAEASAASAPSSSTPL